MRLLACNSIIIIFTLDLDSISELCVYLRREAS